MPSADLEPPLGLLLGRPGGKQMETAPGRHVGGMHTPFLQDTECLAMYCAKAANAVEGVPGSAGLQKRTYPS